MIKSNASCLGNNAELLGDNEKKTVRLSRFKHYNFASIVDIKTRLGVVAFRIFSVHNIA